MVHGFHSKLLQFTKPKASPSLLLSLPGRVGAWTDWRKGTAWWNWRRRTGIPQLSAGNHEILIALNPIESWNSDESLNNNHSSYCKASNIHNRCDHPSTTSHLHWVRKNHSPQFAPQIAQPFAMDIWMIPLKDHTISLIWTFPKSWGYPTLSSIFNGMFHYKPSSYWGTTMTMETSISAGW